MAPVCLFILVCWISSVRGKRCRSVGVRVCTCPIMLTLDASHQVNIHLLMFLLEFIISLINWIDSNLIEQIML